MGQETRIETLRSVLKESQRAKENLERRLSEHRKKRRGKESELTAVNGKLAQIKGVFLKMKEARGIAQHKSEKSQMHADSLEIEIRKKRKFLQQIDEDIAKDEENRNSEIENFEEDLSTLSKQFKMAKQKYSQSDLSEKIKEAEMMNEEAKSKVRSLEEKEINTANYLRSLNVEQIVETNCDFDKETIWKVVTDEKELLEKELLKLTTHEMESCQVK